MPRPVSPYKELRDAWNYLGTPGGTDITDIRQEVEIHIISALNFNLTENQPAAVNGTKIGTITATISPSSAPPSGVVTARIFDGRDGVEDAIFRIRYVVQPPSAPQYFVNNRMRRVSGNIWTTDLYYFGTGHDAEQGGHSPQILERDLDIMVEGNQSYQPAERLALVRITITDAPEPVSRHNEPNPININPRDTTPQHLDWSDAFADPDPTGWRLGLTPTSTTFWSVSNLDPAAHTFDIAPTGTPPPADNKDPLPSLTASGTDGATGITAADTWAVAVNVEVGGQPTTITIGRDLPSGATYENGVVSICIAPDQAGTEDAISLGTYLATAARATGGATGALTADIIAQTLNGAASNYYDGYLGYVIGTGAMTYSGPAIPAGDIIGYELEVDAAAITPDQEAGSLAATADLAFRLLSKWTPNLAIDASNEASILAGRSGQTSPIAVGDYTASLTGLPNDLPADQIPPLHWRLTGANANLFALDYQAVPNGVRASYVGPPRAITDGALDVGLELEAVSTAQVQGSTLTRALSVGMVLPPPTWSQDRYSFSMDDGAQPPIVLGDIVAQKTDDEYGLIYRISRNSGDSLRLFSVVASSGAVAFSGPSVPSRAAATSYSLQAQARQTAAGGHISDWGDPIDIEVAINPVHQPTDSVVLNSHWQPEGGLTRSIQIGETNGFSLDILHAYSAPEGSTYAYALSDLSQAERAIINYTENDSLFHFWGLAVGSATLSLGGTITFPSGTTADLPDIDVSISVHAQAPTASVYGWYQLQGAEYVQVSSLEVSVDEGAAQHQIFTASPLYFYVQNINNRSLADNGFHNDPDLVFSLNLVAGQQQTIDLPVHGNVLARQIPLYADGTNLDYETRTRYTAHLQIAVPAATIGGIIYSAFTADLPISAVVGDVDEGPVFRSDYQVPQITARVGATPHPRDIGGLWSDPEGRSLSYEVRSSADNIVSVALDGHTYTPQYGVVGQANIDARAYDGAIWSPWERVEEYTITAAALAIPTFAWASPTSSVIDQTQAENLAVGTKLITGLYATATTGDTTATLGAISYELAEIPADMVLPPLDTFSISFLWWHRSTSRLYLLDAAASTSTSKILRAYDNRGSREQDDDKSLAVSQILDIYAVSALGYFIGSVNSQSVLGSISEADSATISVGETINLTGVPRSVESWGDGADERIYVAKGSNLEAYSFQSATWAREEGDDFGISPAQGTEITCFGSDATHAWIAARQANRTTILMCFRKSDKNRVPAGDRTIDHLGMTQTNHIFALEVVGDWILLATRQNVGDYMVEVISKPSVS